MECDYCGKEVPTVWDGEVRSGTHWCNDCQSEMCDECAKKHFGGLHKGDHSTHMMPNNKTYYDIYPIQPVTTNDGKE